MRFLMLYWNMYTTYHVMLYNVVCARGYVCFSCKWGSTPCHLEDFTQIATDHGICYTFNDPLSPADELNVTNAGKRQVECILLRFCIVQF